MQKNPFPSRFDSASYAEFRPLYPSELFAPLREKLVDAPKILDVGCGTGLSLRSLHSAFPNSTLWGIDPDSEMLRAAQSALPQAHLSAASAEKFPFPSNEGFDLVTAGSAFHWFDRERFRSEVERVLKPGGFFFVFEYQFPRAVEHRELNEFLRRKFNRDWRAPGQGPRGSLKELTSSFRSASGWKEISMKVPPMIRPLSLDELWGQVISQSRYLHSEAGLTPQEIENRRSDLRSELAGFFPRERLDFDFYLAAFLFQHS